MILKGTQNGCAECFVWKILIVGDHLVSWKRVSGFMLIFIYHKEQRSNWWFPVFKCQTLKATAINKIVYTGIQWLCPTTALMYMLEANVYGVMEDEAVTLL